MARVELIEERSQCASTEQEELFDRVVESRGAMIRPFQVLAHSPAIAGHVADLGAEIRFRSTLPDPVRELVILTAAAALDCAFEWASHLPLARAAGVREEAIRCLEGNGPAGLDRREALLIGFVGELMETGTVAEERFLDAKQELGERGVVELAATVGYYTMLGYVMGASAAC